MKASTSPGVIVGFEGEQNARIIYFDIESELNMWPNSVPTLLYRRPGETKVYPAETSLSGSVLMWTPDAHAMEISGGRGAVQVIFTIPGEKTVIGKSEMLPLVVKRGLGNSEDKPEPAESWIEELTDLAADTEAAAKRAEDAAIVAESAADHAAEKAASEAAGAIAQVAAERILSAFRLDSRGHLIAEMEGELVE